MTYTEFGRGWPDGKSIKKRKNKNKLRNKVLPKTGRLYCHYCNVQVHRGHGKNRMTLATIDHVIPRSLGGSNRKSNLVIACNQCNAAKGNALPGQWEIPCLDRTK